jgi:hypothetical protein
MNCAKREKHAGEQTGDGGTRTITAGIAIGIGMITITTETAEWLILNGHRGSGQLASRPLGCYDACELE